MKLVDLKPRFVQWVAKPQLRNGVAPDEVQSLAHAQGISFDCPTCREDYGDDSHRIALPFRRHGVPAEVNGGHQWEVDGTDFSNLTLRPSVNAAGGGCRWHGWVTNGDVT